MKKVSIGMFALAFILAVASAFNNSEKVFAELSKSFSVNPSGSDIDDPSELYNNQVEVVLEAATTTPSIQDVEDLKEAALEEFDVQDIAFICDDEAEDDLCIVRITWNNITNSYNLDFFVEGQRIS